MKPEELSGNPFDDVFTSEERFCIYCTIARGCQLVKPVRHAGHCSLIFFPIYMRSYTDWYSKVVVDSCWSDDWHTCEMDVE